MVLENLKGFFNPRAIAIIGASEREDSIGTQILRNLSGAYSGLIYPVNPFRQKIQGVNAYPSIDRLPSPVDLAIVATPAHTVPQIVEECGKKGILNIVIVSAGFSECDKTGQALTGQILEHKKKYGLHIIGPNSLGIIRPNSNLYATFTEKKAAPGKIAFISQSAALCGSALDWSLETQVGLSAVASTGLTIDVGLDDLIDYFGTDPQTRVIMVYVESIADVRNFMSAARGYARSKPIVIVKANRYSEHQTPQSLRLRTAMYDASFRRCGLVQVETIDDLFDCAKTLLMQPGPATPDLTIITNAGGPALMAVEELYRMWGKLAKSSDTSLEAISKALPYYCKPDNPIDLLEEATAERYSKVMQICLNDPSSGSLLIMYTPIGIAKPQALATAVIEQKNQTNKNLFVCLMGEDTNCQEARRMLHRNNVPTFRSPEEAVRTFMNVYTHNQNLELLYQTPEELPIDKTLPACLRGIVRRAFFEGRQVLDLSEAMQFLNAYKIPTAKTFFAKTADEAASCALQLGYPVVMKAFEQSVDVFSAGEIQAKFNQLVELANKSSTAALFNVAAVQAKNFSTCQIYLRSLKDSQFGSVIVVGTSKFTGFEDFCVGFPPLNSVLARQMLRNIKAFDYCENATDSAAIKHGVEEMLVRFSQLVIDFPEISSIEINPIVIGGKATYATDAKIAIDLHRIIRESAEHYENLVIAPYPKKYVTKRTLKNGVEVNLRPIKPEDEYRFDELFKSLSKESVRFRFFQVIKELSHDTLSRYCNLDYDREIAIVAELPDENKIIGVVRIIFDLDRKAGEFAIMVSDAWHGLGLGSKLMDSIIEVAKDFRLNRIYSLVDPENEKMLALCNKKGFDVKNIDEYTVEISKNLPPTLT
ncbi:MAG: GNAT family N-acetyltransferase [Candidatus Bathyarchaeota archaeon]|nr:GNAT family N-acetyltransferase [Candidatus Bathyarchaeota archaeon]